MFVLYCLLHRVMVLLTAPGLQHKLTTVVLVKLIHKQCLLVNKGILLDKARSH